MKNWILHVLIKRKNKRPVSFFSIAIILLLFLYNCTNNTFYVKQKKIENYQWNYSEQKKFDVTIDDTTSLFTFSIMLRHAGDYEYSNIYVFLNTIYPNNRLIRDTLEFTLADNTGQWKGQGLSNIKHISFKVKEGVRFPQKGVYSFCIEQGMRKDPLYGITEVGIKLEKQ